MRLNLSLITILLGNLAFFQAGAQSVESPGGQLEIIQDSRIDTLVSRHIWLNQYHQEMEGYRIQIFFDAGNKFLSMSPDSTISAYITFKEPYYRVRVGDFRTRLDAERFLQLIKPSYPNAFPIKEQINLPKL
jgi:hypothetical protein